MSRTDPKIDTVYDTVGLANRLTPAGAEDGGGALSPRTLERWRNTGEGPKFIKLGRRVLYRESAVEAWLDERTRSHTNETA